VAGHDNLPEFTSATRRKLFFVRPERQAEVQPHSFDVRPFWKPAAGLFDDRFLDVAELILAEEHLLSNKERRRAECSPADSIGRQIDQPLLDVILLHAHNQSIDIDARRDECAAKALEVVHLLSFFLHMMVRGTEIRLEHAFELSRDGTSHQHQRIDRKNGLVRNFVMLWRRTKRWVSSA
jgi:hypothetical protein